MYTRSFHQGARRPLTRATAALSQHSPLPHISTPSSRLRSAHLLHNTSAQLAKPISLLYVAHRVQVYVRARAVYHPARPHTTFRIRTISRRVPLYRLAARPPITWTRTIRTITIWRRLYRMGRGRRLVRDRSRRLVRRAWCRIYRLVRFRRPVRIRCRRRLNIRCLRPPSIR